MAEPASAVLGTLAYRLNSYFLNSCLPCRHACMFRLLPGTNQAAAVKERRVWSPHQCFCNRPHATQVLDAAPSTRQVCLAVLVKAEFAHVRSPWCVDGLRPGTRWHWARQTCLADNYCSIWVGLAPLAHEAGHARERGSKNVVHPGFGQIHWG